ncbi:MAG TPA: helix-turn-helix domain-containing protein [Solirubrobacteraceae bacterium]
MSSETGIACATAGAQSAGGAPPAPLYKGLQPRWCGLDSDGVAAHQRLRLHGAMLQAATEKGALRTSVAEVARMAGVSKRTVYDRFSGKQELFLSTYDFAVARAVARIRAAHAAAGDAAGALCAAFQEFLEILAEEPGAARIALVETLGAGPAALARVDRNRRVFETMIAAALPRGRDVSPLVLKGIVGGMERVVRARLLNGTAAELADCAPELARWVHFHSAATLQSEIASLSGHAVSRPVDWRAWLRPQDERTRLLRVTAALAGREGYASLTPQRLAHAAQLPEKIVDECHGGVEECFLASLELLMGVEALAVVIRASNAEQDWRFAIARGVQALLAHLTAHPVLARIAFIEAFGLGPETLDRRAAIGRRFTDLLLQRVPASQRPTELTAELAGGAVWTVIHHCIARDAKHALPRIADEACILALAPMLGGEQAAEHPKLVGTQG